MGSVFLFLLQIVEITEITKRVDWLIFGWFIVGWLMPVFDQKINAIVKLNWTGLHAKIHISQLIFIFRNKDPNELVGRDWV